MQNIRTRKQHLQASRIQKRDDRKTAKNEWGKGEKETELTSTLTAVAKSASWAAGRSTPVRARFAVGELDHPSSPLDGAPDLLAPRSPLDDAPDRAAAA